MVLKYFFLILMLVSTVVVLAEDISFKDVELNRFKKIQKIIKDKQYTQALEKLEIIYKTSKSASTKIKALFFMGKIEEFTGNSSKANSLYLYIQKTLHEDLYESLKENLDEELELDDIVEEIPEVSPTYLKALEQEVSIFYRLNKYLSQSLSILELMKRKTLLLLELESRLTYLEDLLDKIDKQKIEINRKVKKNYFWAGMAQNFFSKNFDISSVSSTIPMNYTGYGPKLSIGYSRESYYRGWMIGGGFASIFGELSIEASGQTDVDYFIKRKNFYIMDGQFTYYIRPYGGESKFGIGIDLSYIAYSLDLPGELSVFKEEGLAMNVIPHFLYEFEKKWAIFFSKLGIVTPGNSMQFELGGKLNF